MKRSINGASISFRRFLASLFFVFCPIVVLAQPATFTPTWTITNTNTPLFSVTPTPTPFCSALMNFGNVYQPWQDSNLGAYSIGAFPASLTSPATIVSISIHCSPQYLTDTTTVGIYSDNGGYPGNLIVSAVSPPLVDGWNNVPVPPTALLAIGNYWLAFMNTTSDPLIGNGLVENKGYYWASTSSMTGVYPSSASRQLSDPAIYANYCLPAGTATYTTTPIFTSTATLTDTSTPTTIFGTVTMTFTSTLTFTPTNTITPGGPTATPTWTPMPGVNVVSQGPAAPSNSTQPSGNGNVPVLQFTINNPSGPPVSISGLTLTASGTGNDLTGIAGVHLYLDNNQNGFVDGGDTLLGSATYSTDNGNAIFSFNNVIFSPGTATYLVTYDFTAAASGTFQTTIASSAALTYLNAPGTEAFTGLPLSGAVITIGVGTVTPSATFTGSPPPTNTPTSTNTSTTCPTSTWTQTNTNTFTTTPTGTLPTSTPTFTATITPTMATMLVTNGPASPPNSLQLSGTVLNVIQVLVNNPDTLPVTLTSLTITDSGTGNAVAGVAGLIFYGTGAPAPATFAGSTATFYGLSEVIFPSSGVTFTVSSAFSNTAPAGTYQFSVSGASGTNGQAVGFSGLPISGAVITIVNPTSTPTPPGTLYTSTPTSLITNTPTDSPTNSPINTPGTQSNTDTFTYTITFTPTPTGTLPTNTPTFTPTVTPTNCGGGTGPNLNWNTMASMPTARMGLGVGVVNGILYAVGGYNYTILNTMEAYDPSTNTWSTKAPMPTARRDLSVGVVNGILYAVGGSDGTNSMSSVEAYDPSTNSWSTKAAMLRPCYGSSVGVINGVLYVVGGGTFPNNNLYFLDTVQAYDPSTNNWITEMPMTTYRDYLSVSVVNGILYAVGGVNGGCNTNLMEAFDPSTNSWSNKTSMSTIRMQGSAIANNGLLYAMGGQYPLVNTVEAYDPSTNTWSWNNPMPTARNSFATGVINGVLYAVGGYDGTNFLGTNEAAARVCAVFTNTPTASTPTPTPWLCLTNTPSFTLTLSVTPSPTPTITGTFPTATNTPTNTITNTATITPTGTLLTVTNTATNTTTDSPTNTPAGGVTLTSTPTPTPVGTPVAVVNQVVIPGLPATVTLSGGVTVSMPVSTFAQPATITISQYSSGSAPATATAFQLNFMPYAYTIDAGGVPLGASVTITLPYDPTLIPAGYTPADLTMTYFNGSSWITLPATIDTVRHTVTVVVNHFSWWGVAFRDHTPTPTHTPLPGGTPPKPVVYPNPATDSNPVHIRLNTTVVSDVKVQVFTTAYKKLQDFTVSNVPAGGDVALALMDKWNATLANGLYYVVVTTSQGKFVQKLLILK